MIAFKDPPFPRSGYCGVSSAAEACRAVGRLIRAHGDQGVNRGRPPGRHADRHQRNEPQT